MSPQYDSPESRRFNGRRLFITILGVTLLATAVPKVVVAGDEDEKLPSGESILDKYVEKTGGKAAYQKIKNRKITAKMSIPAQGLTMQLVSYTAKPNLAFSEFSSEQFGTIQDGCDGEVAWQNHPMMGGPRIKEGAERESAMREATFNSEVEWRSLYASVKCVGVEDVGDEKAYKVELTPKGKDPKPEYVFYGKGSGLLIKREQTQESPMGEIPIVLKYDDYKKVDGVLTPHKMTFIQMGMEMSMVLESVESNIDMPADRFELPEDVKDILAIYQEDAEKTEKKE